MEIQFVPSVDFDLLRPVAAIQKLPDWYKKLSSHIEGKIDKFDERGDINATIKRCNPVGDALNTGYFILLENSISVVKASDTDNNCPQLTWSRGGEQFISSHHPQQLDKQLIPDGFNTKALKFTNFYGIKTPKGYSTLFTHPLNRSELPFYTLQGVVDTDTYHNPVNFPFFIRDNFEGIIPAGTPIAQVIPIKRETWTHYVASPNLAMANKFQQEFTRYKPRWYRNFYWTRKEYK